MFFFDFWDGLFPILFTLIFTVVIVTFVVTIVRGLREWSDNNRAPVLEVEAGVVAKRTDVSQTMHSTGDAAVHATSSTTYFVTFQVRSGDRMELRVSGRDYGQIAEGDFGMLTFQGTRFLGFRRT